MVELYHHCIFICSNYTSGKRYGLHFLFNDENMSNISDISEKYRNKEGVSMYVIMTNKPEIESVKKKDPFYATINILEGTIPANVITFDNMLDNQVSIFDLAMLLLCYKEMTVKELRVYLFLTYCVFTSNERKLICKEKYWIDDKTFGFREINNEFRLTDSDTHIKCTKPDIIMSKFFNSEDGTNLMNKFLQIFINIQKFDFAYLESMSQELVMAFRNELSKTVAKKGKASVNKKTIHKFDSIYKPLI